jgi:superfamily II DNA or RNA helicase
VALTLRPYQQDVKYGIYESWSNGARYVCAVLPTGAGKTVTFADIIRENRGPSCAIAHRQELVLQISLALAKEGVYHSIIGSPAIVKLCVSQHIVKVGRPFYDATAQCAVAGVRTLANRADSLREWMQSVTLWVQDEAHHVLRENEWGKASELFPNARGLGVTATPLRADRKGLGREFDGVFDDMVVGPGMRELIDMGFLTDYRIFAPPSNLIMTDDMISKSTGDYTRAKMTNAVKKSRVVGDVVSHYLSIAPGKLGVTFATDVETATTIAQQFQDAGVPAEVVSAKTPAADRVGALRRFEAREILQLVNVDLFGEGFDLPAIEVVSFARPTMSYGLYVQQFGRVLRLMDGKTEAIIIDHVGNVTRHGLPDAPRPWSLARGEKRQSGQKTTVMVKVCPACTGVFERFYKACPFCDHEPVPVSRSGPEFVDGDLHELDPATLAEMRGAVDRVDMDKEDFRADMASRNVPQLGQLAGVKRHVATQEAQDALRGSIAMWAGHERAAGRNDSESYRKFYLTFGVDVMSAQALKAKDADELRVRIGL